MIKRTIKQVYLQVKYQIKELFVDQNSLKIDWYGGLNNFGDALNPLLIEGLTNKKVLQVTSATYFNNHFFIIGSILDRATKFTTVWGTGFISDTSSCKDIPKKICAVRGPKTRSLLIKQGIKCPEIYGDPALLLPKIYLPRIKKKYKLGIIPHYVDKKNKWLNLLKDESEIVIIDIQNKNLLDFIDILLSCEKIASSSLHGIIVADAYNIPSVWLEFSNEVAGNGFKFYDYFLSVGRPLSKPLVISENTSIYEIINHFYEYKIKIDLNKFLNAAPFDIDLKQIIR